MFKQVALGSKKEEKRIEALTPAQRRLLEKSLQENDELMRCLAEM